jgi:hypothetical protein
MSYRSNDPFEAYKIYIACKLHFESKTYDYFKYNGKSSVTPKSFFARRDKFFFAKVVKKYGLDELKYFYACNFAKHGTKWIGSMNDDGADETYKQYKALMESFTYRFKNDIDKLLSETDFKSLFIIEEGQHPVLVTKLIREEIPLETFVVLNRYLNFMPKFDEQIKDPIVWPDLSQKIRKYDKFISVNNNKVAEALKDCLQSNVSVI